MKERSAKPPRKQRHSLQNDYVLLREIDEDVLYLGSSTASTKRELVASLKVSGTNLALKSTEEQIALISRWRDLLSSLHYPIQLLTQIVPLDMHGYREPYEGAGPAEEGETERRLREEHLALIQQVQESHTLFTRTSHILVPSRPHHHGVQTARTFLAELLWPPKRKRRQRQQRQETFQQLQQQLDLRVRDLSRMLSRMHLPSERLGGDALLHFYARCVLAKRALSPLKPVLIRALDHALHPTPTLLPPEPDAALWEGEPLVRLLPEDPFRGKQKRRQKPGQDAPAKLSPPGSFAQVADLVTPAGLILKPNHIRLLHEKDEYIRTLVIDEMPRDIAIGWLKPLLEINEPFVEVCVHIAPRPKASALAQLRRKRTSYKAARYFSQKHGYLIDDDSEVGEEDADQLARKVASGEERMHEVNCSVVVRADSEDELEARTDRVMAMLETLQVVARPAFLQQDDGYRAALPHVHNPLAQRGSLFLDSTSTAMAFYPFLANSLYMESGVLLGTTPSGDPIAIDKWQFPNANAIFIGKPGSGKSFLKKIWINRLLLKRHKERRQFIIFDPEREYEELCKAHNGEWVRLAAGSPYRINLFDLFYTEDTSTYLGDRLAEKIAWLRELFVILLGTKEANGKITPPKPEVLGLLERVCYEAYRRVGITNNATAKGRQAPLLRDVYEILEKLDEQGEETYSLLSLLYPYVHGSHRAFFDGPTNVRLDNDVIVFDTRELSSEIAPVVLSILSDFVWSVTFKKDMPRELIIDEAGILSKYEAWARFMLEIITRARKHWLAVTLIIQNPEQFQTNPYAKNLMDSCDIKVVTGAIRTATIKQELDLSDREEELISTFGPAPGDALIITPHRRVVARIEGTPLEHRFGTSKASEIHARKEAEARMGIRDSSEQREGPLPGKPDVAQALPQSVSLIPLEEK